MFLSQLIWSLHLEPYRYIWLSRPAGVSLSRGSGAGGLRIEAASHPADRDVADEGQDPKQRPRDRGNDARVLPVAGHGAGIVAIVGGAAGLPIRSVCLSAALELGDDRGAKFVDDAPVNEKVADKDPQNRSDDADAKPAIEAHYCHPL
jgi:hypothetical protein